MTYDIILDYVMLFVILEIVEISWQKSDTIMGMLNKMYKYYNKNVLLFFAMHPTFSFSLGFAILTDYTLGSMLLAGTKTLDIIVKLIFIDKIFIKKELSHEMSLIILAPIDKFLPYIGLLIYPIFIIMALV